MAEDPNMPSLNQNNENPPRDETEDESQHQDPHKDQDSQQDHHPPHAEDPPQHQEQFEGQLEEHIEGQVREELEDNDSSSEKTHSEVDDEDEKSNVDDEQKPEDVESHAPSPRAEEDEESQDGDLLAQIQKLRKELADEKKEHAATAAERDDLNYDLLIEKKSREIEDKRREPWVDRAKRLEGIEEELKKEKADREKEQKRHQKDKDADAKRKAVLEDQIKRLKQQVTEGRDDLTKERANNKEMRAWRRLLLRLLEEAKQLPLKNIAKALKEDLQNTAELITERTDPSELEPANQSKVICVALKAFITKYESIPWDVFQTDAVPGTSGQQRTAAEQRGESLPSDSLQELEAQMDYERNVASSLREDVDALQLQLQEAENKFDELKKKHDEVLKVVRRTAKKLQAFATDNDDPQTASSVLNEPSSSNVSSNKYPSRPRESTTAHADDDDEIRVNTRKRRRVEEDEDAKAQSSTKRHLSEKVVDGGKYQVQRKPQKGEEKASRKPASTSLPLPELTARQMREIRAKAIADGLFVTSEEWPAILNDKDPKVLPTDEQYDIVENRLTNSKKDEKWPLIPRYPLGLDNPDGATHMLCTLESCNKWVPTLNWNYHVDCHIKPFKCSGPVELGLHECPQPRCPQRKKASSKGVGFFFCPMRKVGEREIQLCRWCSEQVLCKPCQDRIADENGPAKEQHKCTYKLDVLLHAGCKSSCYNKVVFSK